MTLRFVVAIALAMLAELPALATEADAPWTILKAWRNGDTIRFQPPTDVAWENLAPTSVSCIAAGECDDRTNDLWVKRVVNYPTDFSTVEFEVGLPEGFAEGHYYYLSSMGCVAIRPKHLVGQLTATFERESSNVATTRYKGYVAADGEVGSSTGGFVIRSATELRFAQSSSRWPVRHYLHSESSTSTGPNTDEDAPYRVAANYEFTLGPSGGTIAYIEWWPHHTCDTFEANAYYSLYAVAGPTRLAFNANRSEFVNEGQPSPALQLPVTDAPTPQRVP